MCVESESKTELSVVKRGPCGLSGNKEAKETWVGRVSKEVSPVTDTNREERIVGLCFPV